MDRDLLALIWPVFRTEAREHLELLGAGVLELERATPPARAELASSLRRTAHTLKGSASSLGLEDIERRAHRLEDLLAEVGGPAFPRERTDAALAAVTEMEAALETVRRWVEGPATPAGPPASATPEGPVLASPALASPVPPELAPADPAGPAPVMPAIGDLPEAVAVPGATPEPVPRIAEREAGADPTVRVPVRALESLIRQVEDLALTPARQERRVRILRGLLDEGALVLRALQQLGSRERLREGGDARELDDAIARLRGIQRELGRLGAQTSGDAQRSRLVNGLVRDDLRDLRAAPAATVLEPLHRVAREVASRLGKEVDLAIEGGDVRLDRRVLEEIKDPLLHLVRNAVDHGIEAPEARAAAGKSRAGRLRIVVEPVGRRVRVTVTDDGPGLDLERIRETAVRRGLLPGATAFALPDEEAARLIFRPGFTTAARVSEISGRGVGLDVVQAAVTRLQGAVDVEPAAGGGTRFVLDLPLTLAAALGVLVRAGGELLALPSDGVERLVRVRPEALSTVAGRVTVEVGETRLPYHVLGQLLGLARGQLPPATKQARPALVLGHGASRIVAAVDEVLGQEALVLQPLGDAAASLPHLAGAAVLDGRRLVPVVSVPELVRAARPSAAARVDAPKRRILCVDDALTTRAAMKAVLELAGFEVIPAGDGEEALGILDRTPVALVVTDVQMPRLDGLGLIRRIRADPRLRALPTILVTSLDAADDRAAGLEAGADAYLVKREVERGRLLELVQQLLPADP